MYTCSQEQDSLYTPAELNGDIFRYSLSEMMKALCTIKLLTVFVLWVARLDI